MGKVIQHNVVEKCDQWLSTRNKKKVSSLQHPIKKHPSSRRNSSSHLTILTQNSPPPPELKTNTKQSSITNFFRTPGTVTPDFRESARVRRLKFDGNEEKENPQEIKLLCAQEKGEEHYEGYKYITRGDNCFSSGLESEKFRNKDITRGDNCFSSGLPQSDKSRNNPEKSESVKGHNISCFSGNGESINTVARSDNEMDLNLKHNIYETSNNENKKPLLLELDKVCCFKPIPNKSKADNSTNKQLTLDTGNTKCVPCESVGICDNNVCWSERSKTSQKRTEYNDVSSSFYSNTDDSYEGVIVGHDTCSVTCTDSIAVSQQRPGRNTGDIADPHSCDFSDGLFTDRKYLLNSEEADMELQDFSLAINTLL